MLRTYEVKFGGTPRHIKFDPAKCKTWDGPQSQVEALVGIYMGETRPVKLDNFQLLGLKVGYVSARCSHGRVSTRDIELCNAEDISSALHLNRAGYFAPIGAVAGAINGLAPARRGGGLLQAQAAINRGYYEIAVNAGGGEPIELIEAERPEE